MRILLVGDNAGIPRLLRHVPPQNVCGLVAAANRPWYHEEVRRYAELHGLPFAIQPKADSGEYPGFRDWVVRQAPDLVWVSSYSMIVRPDVLRIPGRGGINLHGALLPQYRGAHPLQWAILNGETTTGVTLHEMTEGIDEGAIINRREVPLLFEDTWRSAQARIAEAAEGLLTDIAPAILAGKWRAIPQDEKLARRYPRRTPDDGYFEWNEPVRRIYNLIRALVAPHPGAYHLTVDGGRKVFDGYLTPGEITALKYGDGGRQLKRQGIRLRPDPSSGQTDSVRFAVERDGVGTALGTGQVSDIDWSTGCARVSIEGARDADCGTALQLLNDYCLEDLLLSRVSAAALPA